MQDEDELSPQRDAYREHMRALTTARQAAERAHMRSPVTQRRDRMPPGPLRKRWRALRQSTRHGCASTGWPQMHAASAGPSACQ